MKSGSGKGFFLFIKGILAATVISFLLVLTVTFAGFPASPSPIFVFCVLISFLSGTGASLVISGFCGFLLDILCQNTVLTNACLFAYISLGCVWLNKRVKGSLITALLCVFASALLFSVLNSLLKLGFSPLNYLFWEKAIPETLISTAFAVAVYPLAAVIAAKQRCFCGKEKN